MRRAGEGFPGPHTNAERGRPPVSPGCALEARYRPRPRVLPGRALEAAGNAVRPPAAAAWARAPVRPGGRRRCAGWGWCRVAARMRPFPEIPESGVRRGPGGDRFP